MKEPLSSKNGSNHDYLRDFDRINSEKFVDLKMPGSSSNEYKLLSEISLAVASASDISSLMKIIKVTIQPAFNANGARLFIINEAENYYQDIDLEELEIRRSDGVRKTPYRDSMIEWMIGEIQSCDKPVIFDAQDLVKRFSNQQPVDTPVLNDHQEFLAAALSDQVELKGLFYINSLEKNVFKQDRFPLFQAVADLLAVKVINALANEQLTQEKNLQDKLLLISEAIADIRNRNELLRTIYDRIRDILPFHTSGLFVIDEKEDYHQMISDADILGLPEEMIATTEKLPHQGSVVEYLANDFGVVPYAQLRKMFNHPHWELADQLSLEELIHGPLRYGNETIGIFCLWAIEKDTYRAETIPLFKNICSQLAVAVSNVLANEKLMEEKQFKETLLGLSEAVAKVEDRDTLFQTIQEKLNEQFIYEDIGIFVFTDDKQALEDLTISCPEISPSDLNTRLHEQASSNLPIPYSSESGMHYTIDHLRKHNGVAIFNMQEFAKRFPAYQQSKILKELGYQDSLTSLLETRGQILGFFCINSFHRNFSSQQFPLFKAISDQLAVAASNVLANERLLKEKQFKETLLGISQAVARIQDRSELLQVILTKIKPIFRFYDVGLYLINRQEDWFEDLAVSDPEISPSKGAMQMHKDPSINKKLKFSGSGIEWYIQKMEQECCTCIVKYKEDVFNQFPEYEQLKILQEIGYEEGLYALLKVSGRTIGMFNINSLEKNFFHESQFPLFQAIADQLAVAMSNVQANEQIRQKADEKALEVELIKALELHDDLPEKFEAVANILQNHLSFQMIGYTAADNAHPFCHYLVATGTEEYQVLDKEKLIDVLSLSEKDFHKLQQHRKKYHTLTELPEGGQLELLVTHIAKKWQMGTVLSLSIPLSQGTKAYMDLFAQKESAFSTAQVRLMERLVGTLALALDRQLAQMEIARLNDQLRKENEYLLEEVARKYHFSEIIGNSESLQRVFRQIEQVAPTDATVLVQGETGTGKELIARAIHQHSPRRDHLLVKVNCAAIPEALFESELFGHEKGAFTGAIQQRIGKFELAHQGTVFLDEIGELPLNMQAKLLRVLQEQEFERVGGNKSIRSDFRVVAATNRELLDAIEAGKFRADLFYRLSTFPITLLPLRDRPEDLSLLAEHFARQYSRHIGVPFKGFTKAAVSSMENYDFPGNIRELRNMVEHAVILSNGQRIDQVMAQKVPFIAPKKNGGVLLPSYEEITKEYIAREQATFERKAILKVLEATKWRIRGKNGAASILGLVPTTLESRMKKLDIER